MTTTEPSTSIDDPLVGLLGWLEASWDPELTLAEWWDRLGRSGWAAPMLPSDRFGRALGRRDALRCARLLAEFGAVGAPVGLGVALAAPTIAVHGTTAQVRPLRRPDRVGAGGVVPAVQRAGRGLGPGGAVDPGGARRGRLDRERAEGVDLNRAPRGSRHAARQDQPLSTQAPGHHLVRPRHAPARGRGAPAASDDRRRPTSARCSSPTRSSTTTPASATCTRVGGREHHARLRASRHGCGRERTHGRCGCVPRDGRGPPRAPRRRLRPTRPHSAGVAHVGLGRDLVARR